MKLPTPKNVIWCYRRSDVQVWLGLVWFADSSKILARVEPFAESDGYKPTPEAEQMVLSKFWRKLGAA